MTQTRPRTANRPPDQVRLRSAGQPLGRGVARYHQLYELLSRAIELRNLSPVIRLAD